MSSRVLVTGGSGFIGTHLCQLLHRDYSVRVLDLEPPKDPVEGVEYLQGDIRQLSRLREAVRGSEFVVHLAARVSVELCEQEVEEGFSTNVHGSLSLLDTISDLQKDGSPIGLVFASSAAAVNPISNYGIQKVEIEKAIRRFSEERKLRGRVLRFFNVFGPGQDPLSPYSGVITIFGKRLEEGLPLILHGGGEQTRDFVHVVDIARSIRACLERPWDPEPIEIGTGSPVSVRALAEEMARVYGKDLRLEHAASRKGDIAHSCSDPSAARDVLGWEAQISLGEGLRTYRGA